MALRGEFRAEGHSLYVSGSGGRIAASDAARVGNAFLLTRGSEGALPTPFGPYCAERLYADHYKFDAARVDWISVALDAGGIVADVFTLGIAGRLVNAAQVARRSSKLVGTWIGYTDLGYGLTQAASDGRLTEAEAKGLATDLAGLRWPVWPDLLGLRLTLGEGFVPQP